MTLAKKPSRMVYFFFFFSGATALVYEIIWTRMLTVAFGHTVFSVSVVLAAFMAGLGFGCYLWGHLIDRVATRDGKEELGRLLTAAHFEDVNVERYKISWLWGMMTAQAQRPV